MTTLRDLLGMPYGKETIVYGVLLLEITSSPSCTLNLGSVAMCLKRGSSMLYLLLAQKMKAATRRARTPSTGKTTVVSCCLAVALAERRAFFSDLVSFLVAPFSWRTIVHTNKI